MGPVSERQLIINEFNTQILSHQEFTCRTQTVDCSTFFHNGNSFHETHCGNLGSVYEILSVDPDSCNIFFNIHTLWKIRRTIIHHVCTATPVKMSCCYDVCIKSYRNISEHIWRMECFFPRILFDPNMKVYRPWMPTINITFLSVSGEV